MKFNVQHFRSIPSTNKAVKLAIDKGKPEGFAVHALSQSAGYGRQGRTWQSPPGGMYLSVLLRPKTQKATELPTLSLAVGVALRRTIASFATRGTSAVKVKWPNDIVLAQQTGQTINAPITGTQLFRKLAGISLETYKGAVCLGIGVNVFRPAEQASAPTQLQQQTKNVPAYICDLGLECAKGSEASTNKQQVINKLANAVAVEIADAYALWCEAGFAAFAADLNSHSALTGLNVRIQNMNNNTFAQGTVKGVAEDGCLILQNKAGNTTHISSGEAHICW